MKVVTITCDICHQEVKADSSKLVKHELSRFDQLDKPIVVRVETHIQGKDGANYDVCNMCKDKLAKNAVEVKLAE